MTIADPAPPPSPPAPHPAPPETTRPAERNRKVQRIVILGGGFGGVYTALNLEKIFRRNEGVEITLISRDNYFLMTPFLFEAGSGVLEPRHAVSPIRMMFSRARFVDAEVERIDFNARKVHARHTPDNFEYDVEYDQLVIALGGITNRSLIPGSEKAFGFKTLGDAIFLRNKIIDLLEQADVEEDVDRRRKLLTLVIIGGGLVGVELMGEMTEFVHNLLRSYPRIPRELVRFVLIEAHNRIMPEMEESLAAYATDVLWKRGVSFLTGVRVKAIEEGKVVLPEGVEPATIDAETIILTAGLTANPLLEKLPLEKAKNGRVVVDGSMRTSSHHEVWALGDCAAIPDKNGNPYPPLAQHALREARVLARNIAAVVRGGRDAKIEKFDYETMGMLASLGRFRGVGRVGSFKIRGFLAWWVWRSYYLLQMPRWERKIRVVLDWTIALFFRNDVVKLDLFGETHPTRKSPCPPQTPVAGVQQVD